MALEVATYINQLVSTNPPSTDQVSQGDDHVRLLKAVLQNTFPNITGAITLTHTEINSLLPSVTAIQADYIKKDGSVSFTGEIAGITPTISASLATKGYVDSQVLTLLAAANVWTEDQSIQKDQPFLHFKDNSGFTAGSIVGGVNFVGLDSTSAETTYGQIYTTIDDPTNGSEDGRINLVTLRAGSLTNEVAIYGGIAVNPAVNGVLGVGTLNATGLYRQGVELLPLTSANMVAELGFTPGPRPTTSAGVGQWTHVIAAGGNITLPAGGTWAWFYPNGNASQSGVNAGGSVIAVASNDVPALCFRVT